MPCYTQTAITNTTVPTWSKKESRFDDDSISNGTTVTEV